MILYHVEQVIVKCQRLENAALSRVQCAQDVLEGSNPVKREIKFAQVGTAVQRTYVSDGTVGGCDAFYHWEVFDADSS